MEDWFIIVFFTDFEYSCSHPTPFDCRFVPRSKDATALIQAEVMNLDEKL
jgi:hypothetical protein